MEYNQNTEYSGSSNYVDIPTTVAIQTRPVGPLLAKEPGVAYPGCYQSFNDSYDSDGEEVVQLVLPFH